jgi:hypothetical protein
VLLFILWGNLFTQTLILLLQYHTLEKFAIVRRLVGLELGGLLWLYLYDIYTLTDFVLLWVSVTRGGLTITFWGNGIGDPSMEMCIFFLCLDSSVLIRSIDLRDCGWPSDFIFTMNTVLKCSKLDLLNGLEGRRGRAIGLNLIECVIEVLLTGITGEGRVLLWTI